MYEYGTRKFSPRRMEIPIFCWIACTTTAAPYDCFLQFAPPAWSPPPPVAPSPATADMAAAAEVYTPSAAAAQHGDQAAWRAVLGWLGFLLQVLLRAIRGAPSSCAKLLKLLCVRRPLLSADPAPAFARLPSQAPADELLPLSAPPGRLTVRTHLLARGRMVACVRDHRFTYVVGV